jgi:2-haloalkanoic acid dehalogenase type II
MQKFEIVTFDCYGTLIDWESGISGAFARMAPELPREAIPGTYASIEPIVESQEYRRYRDVLAETAYRVGDALGRRVTDPSFLAGSLPSWQPFPDTNPALERLRAAGYRLGILSNVDRDLLAETRKHFTVDFDLIITAEDVGSYKPAPGHFLAARQQIGDAAWLHAAQSNYHDVVPVNAMGVPTAWVNRHRGTPLPGGVPTYEVPDMAGLADLLT